MKKVFKLAEPFLFLFCFVVSTKIFAQDSLSIQHDSLVTKTDTTKPSKPTDVIEVAIRVFNIDTTRKPRSTKKVNFSFLPSAATVPGGGAAIVTTLNAAFYLGDKTQTNLSTVEFTPVITTTKKILLSLKSSVWLKNNSANIAGEIRYFKYPDYTWGLGGSTPEENRSLLEFENIRFYQSILKKIVGSLSAGMGYRFDHYYNIEEELEDSSKAPNLKTYS